MVTNLEREYELACSEVHENVDSVMGMFKAQSQVGPQIL